MQEVIVRQIPIENIIEENRQRKEYPGIKELANNIKDIGLLHPLVVRTCEKPGYVLLMAGGRRLRALKLLEWKDVPCHVFQNEIDARTHLMIEMSENIQREGFSPVEKAEGIARLSGMMRELASLQKRPYHLLDTANKIGVDVRTVQRAQSVANMTSKMPAEQRNVLVKSKVSQQDILDAAKKAKKKKAISKQAEEVKQQQVKTPENIILKQKIEAYKLFKYDESLPIGEQGFFSFIKGIKDETFDFLEIDPPYGIDFNKSDRIGIEDYFEVPKKEYQSFLYRLLEECHRVQKQNTYAVIWHAEKYLPMIYAICRKVGYEWLSTTLTWYKTSFGGESKGGGTSLVSVKESCLIIKKGPCKFQPGFEIIPNVLAIPPLSPTQKIHPAERPPALIQRILQTFCPSSGYILVPFAGSGRTMKEAINLGMSAIGTDISEQYYNNYIASLRGE